MILDVQGGIKIADVNQKMQYHQELKESALSRIWARNEARSLNLHHKKSQPGYIAIE
jgi:hypothetical protein